MPVACTNCYRFHYGPCKELPKQCFCCGGFNHMDRYCPNSHAWVKPTRGEPLAGTRGWCEVHGLNHDPDLKRRILNALKTSPGSAIWLGGVCIYQGNESYFERSDQGRGAGRPLQKRITRRRSRSPSTQREPERGRSPAQRYQSQPRYRGYDEAQNYQQCYRATPRYRSRSPIPRRRTPSPYHHPEPRPRSPRFTSYSHAVVFEARAGDNRPERSRPTPVRDNMPVGHEAQATRNSLIQLSTANSQAVTRAPLGQVSHNITRGVSMKQSQPDTQPINFRQSLSSVTAQSSSSSSTISPKRVEPEVADPYFVLGISKEATENEIVDAFEQRIWETELERISEGILDDAVARNVWDESIRILNAAKRQLVGY